jgi:hypothetical protein
MGEKVWAVKVDGRMVQIQDLALDTLAGIAERNKVSWIDVISAPARDAHVARDVLAAACTHAGTEAPTAISGREMLERFELIEDDKPQEFTDGIPPQGAGRSTL